MYGHPALVTDHARALAPSPRAFNRWFWKTFRQAGLFPELEKCPTGSFQAFFADPQTHVLPSPAPSAQLMEQAGGLYSLVAVSSTTATNCNGLQG